MNKRFLIFTIIAFCIMSITQNASDGILDIHDELQSVSDISDDQLSSGVFSICPTENEFSVPRPTNLSNIPRSHTFAKRTATRINSAFCLLKDGKFLNKRSTTQYKFNLNRFPSGLTESTHHLISLGKLVI